MNAPGSALSVERLVVSMGAQQILHEVSVTVPERGIVTVLGANGVGKTTLMRTISGVYRASSGRVVFHGQDITAQASHRIVALGLAQAPEGRQVFASMSVRENLLLGGAMLGREDFDTTFAQVLDRFPVLRQRLGQQAGSLSGGEQQMLAIARALATQPKLLLLDEPLASLDVARRREVLPWLERLRAELKIPMLYVTHSVDELARLADHLVMLEAGQVRACGPIAQALVSQAVAQAIGEEAGMLSTGVVLERSALDHMAQVDLGGGARLWVRDQGLAVGQTVRVRILARDVSFTLSEHADTTIQNRLPGVLESIEADAHPPQALVRARCGQALILGRVTHRAVQQLGLAPGVALWCQVKSAALIL